MLIYGALKQDRLKAAKVPLVHRLPYIRLGWLPSRHRPTGDHRLASRRRSPPRCCKAHPLCLRLTYPPNLLVQTHVHEIAHLTCRCPLTLSRTSLWKSESSSAEATMPNCCRPAVFFASLSLRHLAVLFCKARRAERQPAVLPSYLLSYLFFRGLRQAMCLLMPVMMEVPDDEELYEQGEAHPSWPILEVAASHCTATCRALASSSRHRLFACAGGSGS